MTLGKPKATSLTAYVEKAGGGGHVGKLTVAGGTLHRAGLGTGRALMSQPTGSNKIQWEQFGASRCFSAPG